MDQVSNALIYLDGERSGVMRLISWRRMGKVVTWRIRNNIIYM